MEIEHFNNQILKIDFLDVRCYSATAESKRFSNCNSPKTLTVLKFCDNKTGEHLFSISGFQFPDNVASQNDSSKIHHFIKVYVKLKGSYVYRYTWEDVNNNLCTREHLGEIHKDKEGNPVICDIMSVYISMKKYFHMSSEEMRQEFEEDVDSLCQNKFQEHYIPLDNPNIQNIISYKNDYKERKKDEYERKLQEERDAEYEEMENLLSELYDTYEEHKYEDIYMTEEDKVMKALEGDAAEYYGY